MSASTYEIPSWAGKPPTGLHLDVTKDGKLVQKLMVDEKRCYLFGRNSQLNDFTVDHGSCSRVHAALVYHKHLGRTFLVDCGSTHGTFIGNIRLEGHKPMQMPVDSKFRFGASTRTYILRERPQTGNRPIMDELEKSAAKDSNVGEAGGGRLLGLPETEMELDNLTEFNTAHNRRITMLGISDGDGPGGGGPAKKRRKIRIQFNEEEDVINPEDVDPSIGRFRNMVETTVILKKRPYGSTNDLGLMGNPNSSRSDSSSSSSKRMASHGLTSPTKFGPDAGLYDDMDSGLHQSGPSLFASSLSSKLGIPLPNPAPEIDIAPTPPKVSAHMGGMAMGPPSNLPSASSIEGPQFEDPDEPKRKKYAKEAWPGKKPTPSLL